MTNGALIKELKKHPADLLVKIWDGYNCKGYKEFGSIEVFEGLLCVNVVEKEVEGDE